MFRPALMVRLIRGSIICDSVIQYFLNTPITLP